METADALLPAPPPASWKDLPHFHVPDILLWKCLICEHSPDLRPELWLCHMNIHIDTTTLRTILPTRTWPDRKIPYKEFLVYYKYLGLSVVRPNTYHVRGRSVLEIIKALARFVDWGTKIQWIPTDSSPCKPMSPAGSPHPPPAPDWTVDMFEVPPVTLETEYTRDKSIANDHDYCSPTPIPAGTADLYGRPIPLSADTILTADQTSIPPQNKLVEKAILDILGSVDSEMATSDPPVAIPLVAPLVGTGSSQPSQEKRDTRENSNMDIPPSINKFFGTGGSTRKTLSDTTNNCEKPNGHTHMSTAEQERFLDLLFSESVGERSEEDPYQNIFGQFLDSVLDEVRKGRDVDVFANQTVPTVLPVPPTAASHAPTPLLLGQNTRKSEYVKQSSIATVPLKGMTENNIRERPEEERKVVTVEGEEELNSFLAGAGLGIADEETTSESDNDQVDEGRQDSETEVTRLANILGLYFRATQKVMLIRRVGERIITPRRAARRPYSAINGPAVRRHFYAADKMIVGKHIVDRRRKHLSLGTIADRLEKSAVEKEQNSTAKKPVNQISSATPSGSKKAISATSVAKPKRQEESIAAPTDAAWGKRKVVGKSPPDIHVAAHFPSSSDCIDNLDRKALRISGFKTGTKRHNIQQYFPDAVDVGIQKGPTAANGKRFAILLFASEEHALTSLITSRCIAIGGQQVSAEFPTKTEVQKRFGKESTTITKSFVGDVENPDDWKIDELCFSKKRLSKWKKKSRHFRKGDFLRKKSVFSRRLNGRRRRRNVSIKYPAWPSLIPLSLGKIVSGPESRELLIEAGNNQEDNVVFCYPKAILKAYYSVQSRGLYECFNCKEVTEDEEIMLYHVTQHMVDSWGQEACLGEMEGRVDYSRLDEFVSSSSDGEGVAMVAKVEKEEMKMELPAVNGMDVEHLPLPLLMVSDTRPPVEERVKMVAELDDETDTDQSEEEAKEVVVVDQKEKQKQKQKRGKPPKILVYGGNYGVTGYLLWRGQYTKTRADMFRPAWKALAQSEKDFWISKAKEQVIRIGQIVEEENLAWQQMAKGAQKAVKRSVYIASGMAKRKINFSMSL